MRNGGRETGIGNGEWLAGVSWGVGNCIRFVIYFWDGLWYPRERQEPCYVYRFDGIPGKDLEAEP